MEYAPTRSTQLQQYMQYSSSDGSGKDDTGTSSSEEEAVAQPADHVSYSDDGSDGTEAASHIDSDRSQEQESNYPIQLDKTKGWMLGYENKRDNCKGVGMTTDPVVKNICDYLHVHYMNKIKEKQMNESEEVDDYNIWDFCTPWKVVRTYDLKDQEDADEFGDDIARNFSDHGLRNLAHDGNWYQVTLGVLRAIRECQYDNHVITNGMVQTLLEWRKENPRREASMDDGKSDQEYDDSELEESYEGEQINQGFGNEPAKMDLDHDSGIELEDDSDTVTSGPSIAGSDHDIRSNKGSDNDSDNNSDEDSDEDSDEGSDIESDNESDNEVHADPATGAAIGPDVGLGAYTNGAVKQFGSEEADSEDNDSVSDDDPDETECLQEYADDQVSQDADEEEEYQSESSSEDSPVGNPNDVLEHETTNGADAAADSDSDSYPDADSDAALSAGSDSGSDTDSNSASDEPSDSEEDVDEREAGEGSDREFNDYNAEEESNDDDGGEIQEVAVYNEEPSDAPGLIEDCSSDAYDESNSDSEDDLDDLAAQPSVVVDSENEDDQEDEDAVGYIMHSESKGKHPSLHDRASIRAVIS